MISSLKEIFQQKIKAKSVVPFSNAELEQYIKINRSALGLIDNWVDNAAFENSCFNYGVPDFIKKDINKQINNSPTYTDLMLLISRKYFKKTNYLEIGVSVGKNFFQLLNGHERASFTGFDIEEINPVLEQKMMLDNKMEWETLPGSIKKSKSSLKTYKFNGMQVKYLSADVWDENSWSSLKGNKFNMIFSDALHTPEAILFEFEMLVKYDLLDDKFVIVWDDLVGKMKRSFYKIIKKYNKIFELRDVYLLNINGWIGEYEGPHSVGIISNFAF